MLMNTSGGTWPLSSASSAPVRQHPRYATVGGILEIAVGALIGVVIQRLVHQLKSKAGDRLAHAQVGKQRFFGC